MVCKEVLPLMHKHFDGELAVAESTDLQAHLSVCETCHHYFKQLERTEAIIRSMIPAPISSPDYLTERIMESLPLQRKRNVFSRWIKRHPAASVAVVFIAIMLGSFLTLWDEDPQLMVKGSGFDQVIIKGNTVYVPEGNTIYGDLIVKGGRVQVDGDVQGNIVVIDGSLNMASTAHISGKISYVNQAMDWIWFKMNEMFGLFSK